MRSGANGSYRSVVRFVIDFTTTGGDAREATDAAPDERGTRSFSGWVELLNLLQGALGTDQPAGIVAAASPGRARPFDRAADEARQESLDS